MAHMMELAGWQFFKSGFYIMFKNIKKNNNNQWTDCKFGGRNGNKQQRRNSRSEKFSILKKKKSGASLYSRLEMRPKKE